MTYKTIETVQFDGTIRTCIAKIYENGSSTVFVLDPPNPLADEYLAWLQEGNTPEEWKPDAPE